MPVEKPQDAKSYTKRFRDEGNACPQAIWKEMMWTHKKDKRLTHDRQDQRVAHCRCCEGAELGQTGGAWAGGRNEKWAWK